ncbi:MAG: hypothetical protein J4203_00670 [Candidatus Diapherotrites archaeon]|uniref:Uncharacterized protein n=1 Tax=Candidatus Iainarchaeum sp. TaxID=3101447 RepID=A0A8T4L9X6_9ARCH|nr:hypothetical protein [Candidatus Diapherotrites archaeon]
MTQQMVTIPRDEYLALKKQAKIDLEFVKDLVSSLADIKAGRVRQVR